MAKTKNQIFTNLTKPFNIILILFVFSVLVFFAKYQFQKENIYSLNQIKMDGYLDIKGHNIYYKDYHVEHSNT